MGTRLAILSGRRSNGTYANSLMKYAVSADGTMRIGSGIGPELGISVALAAPSVTGPGSGVYIYPQYVLNAASYAPFTAGVSPGEVVTLAGLNLAASPQVATSPPFPTTLGSVQVMVNGIAAPLISVSSTQVSFLVPYEVTSSLAGIQVVNSGTNGGTSNTVTLPVNLTTPGLFTFQQNGIGSVAALHAKLLVRELFEPGTTGRDHSGLSDRARRGNAFDRGRRRGAFQHL